MIRLHVLVEGQTEETFVTQVLTPHLQNHNVWSNPIIVATRRDPSGLKHRGGGQWKQWEKNLRLLMRERAREVRFTSLFDLYGLPQDFPGLTEHGAVVDTRQRVELLEKAMADEVRDPRFLPYLQRHEFEALVLAALEKLPMYLEKESDRRGVAALKRSLGALAPEDINDGPNSAPSKRLLQHIPGYRKAVHGPTATQQEGLASLRAQCPHFHAWVTQLESLDDASSA